MKTLSLPTHNVSIYIGSQERYKGKDFGKYELMEAIADYQTLLGDKSCTVRITRCGYLYQSYWEKGYQISTINYCRFPKPVELIEKFMLGLAEKLLYKFNQNRISIVMPENTIMISQDDDK